MIPHTGPRPWSPRGCVFNCPPAAEADLPDGYFVQVQWYLSVTGLPLAYGAADTGKAELTIVPIEADEHVHSGSS